VLVPIQGSSPPSRTPFAPVVGAILAAAACAMSGAADAPPRHVGAWVTYWDLDRGMERLTRTPGAVEDVFFFAAELRADGLPALALKEADLERSLGRLRQSGGARAWLTVVNDTRLTEGKPPKLKDADAVHRMLSGGESRAAHRRRIVELAARLGFAGVDIDYENLLPEDRDAFSVFVRELQSDLSSRGLKLSVTVQPKRGESRSVGPGAADWSQLCSAADRLQIMLYNLHSSKTGPGPLADRKWVGEVMGYARGQCESARIVPVLKISGMDWGKDGVKDVGHADAMSLLSANKASLQRDAEGTPFFSYDGKDGSHTVYFEDAQSVLAKASWLQEMGHDRVVFWSLGREDADLLPRLLSSPPSPVSVVPPGGPSS
jgi:spore germination protein YaaH